MSSKQEHSIPISRVEKFLEILKQRIENGTLDNADDLRETAESTLKEAKS